MQDPAKRNALGGTMLDGLTRAFRGFAGQDIRAVVLRAQPEDRVWCAGFDIGDLAPDFDPLAQDGPLQGLFRAIAECPAPVIAMLHGSAWGGGTDLALRCDIAVADPTCTLAFTPARLGLPYDPDGLLNVMLRGGLHVAMEMFATEAGIKLLHVPYRGAGPAVTGILSGQIQALASAPGVIKPQVDAGTMRVLANWGAERVGIFPDLPTFRELGYPDVEFYIWAGLFAPRGLPDAIMVRLADAVRQAMADPDLRRVFEATGSPPAYQDAAEFGRFVAADSERLIRAVAKIGKVE